MKDQTKLERLIGKTFIYNQNHILIKDYFMILEEGIVNIITDKNPISIKETELTDFINRCLPVADVDTQAVQVINESRKDLIDLKAILMDNINKVKENKDYIPQSKIVNNSVNTLLRMVSIEVQISKQMKK